MTVEQYLQTILEPLLKHPADLKIVTSNDDLGVLLSVSCHQDDMGAVIGKFGETSKAIRQLVRIVGYKQNARVSVKINEPDGRPYTPRKRE